MKMKRGHYNLSGLRHSLLAAAFLLPVLITGCVSAERQHTPCEERCEYTRRDCIQRCGNYNNFGFSVDFGGKGFSEPYACTDKCERFSESCLNNCRAQNPGNE